MAPTGFPFSTGDVLPAASVNELVQFSINTQSGTTYTVVAADQFQVLVRATNAAAKTFDIPTDATLDYPIGTAITFLNSGAGDLTIDAVTPATTTITSAAAVPAAPVVGQHKAATAIKLAADAWTVVGAVS
jgi:hypothetical protein